MASILLLRQKERFTGALLYTKVAGGHTFVATKREMYRSSALHKGCRGAYFCGDEKRDVPDFCFTQRLQGGILLLRRKDRCTGALLYTEVAGEHTFVATKREMYRSSALHKGCRGSILLLWQKDRFTGALLYTEVAGGAYFCCDKKRDVPELCFTQRLQGEHTFVATNREIYQSSALHRGCRGSALHYNQLVQGWVRPWGRLSGSGSQWMGLKMKGDWWMGLGPCSLGYNIVSPCEGLLPLCCDTISLDEETDLNLKVVQSWACYFLPF